MLHDVIHNLSYTLSYCFSKIVFLPDDLDLIPRSPDHVVDFFRTDSESGRAAQIRSFEAHIELAKKHDLALQIHDRDAHEEVVRTLLRVGAPDRVVFHCFSGDIELASILAERGWYASFAGTVTFKNARNLRDSLEILPRALLLVETDAPFLTPHPHRGRPNGPYLLPWTVRAIADHLGTEQFSEALVESAERVYRRSPEVPLNRQGYQGVVEVQRGPGHVGTCPDRTAQDRCDASEALPACGTVPLPPHGQGQCP
jgi:TatD DNase family protein